MNRLLPAAIAAAVLVLAGCASPDPAAQFLETHELDGLSGKELVEQLDTSSQPRPLPYVASVREDEVLLGDESTEVSVALPDDEFYLSIAPFVETTHECYYHSLATCQGEMVEQDVTVPITDDAGAVLVDEAATTYPNGFVGFWVPRNISGTIEVTAGDLSGSVPFGSSDGDPTCITTLQLS